MQSRSYGWLDERQEERSQVRIKTACTYFTILRLFFLSESLAFRGGHDLVTGKAAAAAATVDIVQENQAVKRQRLDDGRVRQVKGDEIEDGTFKSISLQCCNSFDACAQILNVKTRVLPHKGRADLAGSSEKRTCEDVHPVKVSAKFLSLPYMLLRYGGDLVDILIQLKDGGHFAGSDSICICSRNG